jgi:hypothetical protein
MAQKGYVRGIHVEIAVQNSTDGIPKNINLNNLPFLVAVEGLNHVDLA